MVNTKLGKSLSLGGTYFSPTLHSCSHTSFQLSVFILFHCIIHARIIFSLSSCVFEKLRENPKIFLASFRLFCLSLISCNTRENPKRFPCSSFAYWELSRVNSFLVFVFLFSLICSSSRKIKNSKNISSVFL
jgi:hypothetical protein